MRYGNHDITSRSICQIFENISRVGSKSLYLSPKKQKGEIVVSCSRSSQNQNLGVFTCNIYWDNLALFPHRCINVLGKVSSIR